MALTRRTAVTVAKRNESVVQRIHAWKAAPPCWGYRRLGAQLRFVDGLLINKKRVLRLMRAHALLGKPTDRLNATRTPGRSKPRPTAPQPWWGIAMPKGLVEPVGWGSLVLVRDWDTKQIVGYYAGLQAKSTHWLLALEQAVQRQFPAGVQGQGLSLLSDKGGSRRRSPS